MGLKRIAVLGEIGSGNLGDDFGYVLLRKELEAAFDQLDILVDIRPLTPNLEGLLCGYHWDAVVTGVGTLLDYSAGQVTRMLREAAGKCPVAILGTGISDVGHIVPTGDGRALFAELCAKVSRYTWLRGESAGLDPSVAGPDPMWLAGWRHDGTPKGTVGFNLGYAGWSRLRLDGEYTARVRSVRASLRGPSIALAAWSADHQWLTKILRDGERAPTITGTTQTMRPLQCCRSVLCTRIHLGVLAACHGALPVLPAYADKVAKVFAETEVPRTLLDVDASTGEIAEALSQRAEGKPAVMKAREVCRARVREAAQAIAGAW